jgi:hypothetical protein
MLESCCGRRREKLRRSRTLASGSSSGVGRGAGRSEYSAVALEINDSGGEESGLLGYQSGDDSPPSKIGARIPVARSISEMHLSNESVTAAPRQQQQQAQRRDDDPDCLAAAAAAGLEEQERLLELVGVKVIEAPKELFDSAELVFEVVQTPPGSEESVMYRSWEHCTVDVRDLQLPRCCSPRTASDCSSDRLFVQD